MQGWTPSVGKIGTGIAAVVLALVVSTTGTAVVPQALPVYWQGFELDDEGWFPHPTYGGAVERVASGSGADEAYAPGVGSEGGSHHARLRLGTFLGGFGNIGPFTSWGGTLDGEPNGAWPVGGYFTQVRIYLDVEYAGENPDKRFDLLSSINRADGAHLRDFAFNAGTSPTGDESFVVSASNNAFRSSAWPANPARDPVWIDESGWYTFRHTFVNESGIDGALLAILQIDDADGNEVAQWLLGGDPGSDLGGHRSGWFANNEIEGLAIDGTLRGPADLADAVPGGL